MVYKYKGREKEYKQEYNRERYQAHREENRRKANAYYQIHKERITERGKKRYQKMKIEVLTYYGNGKLACVNCGFNNILALSIDHIKGGGIKHRKELKLNGNHFYSWLRNQGFPKGYQTLCMNCQFVKRATNDENSHQGQGNKAKPD